MALLLLFLYSICSFIFRLQFNLQYLFNIEFTNFMEKICVVLSISSPSLFMASYLLIQTYSSESFEYGEGFRICQLIRNKKLYEIFRTFIISKGNIYYMKGLEFVEDCENKKVIPYNKMFKECVNVGKTDNALALLYYFDTAIYSFSKEFIKSEMFFKV